MGELIHLTALRAERDRRSPSMAPAFFFDVSDPLSYLTAEHVERSLGDVAWIAVDGAVLTDGIVADQPRRLRAEARARALRLPLVWPDRFPASTPCALRAAAYACEIGAGARFVLAASRLAFCGGFDLEDPEVLTEAAAAAGVPLEGCLEAAREHWRDDELIDNALDLRAQDISRLPAITVGGRWFAGDGALVGASAARAEPRRAGGLHASGEAAHPAELRVDSRSAAGLRAERHRYRRPLAPVG